MFSLVRPALALTVLFTLLLGVAYPLAVTGLGQAAFPVQAGGSLIHADGKVVGSALLAQGFAKPQYLHPRPSAAGTNGYDASASSGSNLGPLSPDLTKRVADSAQALAKDGTSVITADAVTTSGSGLDPDISPQNAYAQARRIAAVRRVSEDAITHLIASNISPRWLGIFGQPRVNVLAVNLALDARYPLGHVPAS